MVYAENFYNFINFIVSPAHRYLAVYMFMGVFLIHPLPCVNVRGVGYVSVCVCVCVCLFVCVCVCVCLYVCA